MTNNNNEISEDTNDEPQQIMAEPIIAVFIHENQFYVSTPEELSPEYYHALGALLNKIFDDTPQMFEDLKALINDKDFNNKVN